MTRRLLGIWLLTAGWLGLGAGAARAQGEPCDMPSYADPCGAGGEAEASPPAAPAAGPRAGALKAGGRLMFAKGVHNFVGDISFAYVELEPWVTYQINEKIAAGVSIPMMLSKPSSDDLPAMEEIDTVQALVFDGRYALRPGLAAKAMVGSGVPARLALNPFGGGVGFPGRFGDWKLGFGVGAGYVHTMDELELSADAMLVVQLDSAVSADGTETLTVLHVPLAATYAASDRLSVGVATGIYTGDELSFDPDKSFTLPFAVLGRYAVRPRIDVGGFLGVGSIVTQEGLDVGDTLAIGLSASYSK